MRNFFSKHVFFQVVAACIMAEILHFAFAFMLRLCHVAFESNLSFFVREVLIKVLPCVITAGAFGTLYVLRNPLKGLGKSFLSGGWFLFISIFGCFLFIPEALKNGAKLKSIPELLFFVLFLLMVGFSEELLLRGTVERILLNHFGDTGRGMVISVVVSALLFGLYHFPNYFSGQGLRSTLMQMIGTAMMGMLFGAVYAKRQNLYGVAILHAALDFFTLGEAGLLQGASLASVCASPNQSTFFWTLISNGTFVIAAIIVTLPKKKNSQNLRKKRGCLSDCL